MLSLRCMPVDSYGMVISFLEPYENICTGLMARLVQQEKSVFVLVADKDIIGVLFCAHGTVLHCLPFTFTNTESNRLFRKHAMTVFSRFFSAHPVFCLSGFLPGTEFLQEAVASAGTYRETELRNYYLMEYSGTAGVGRSMEAPVKVVRCTVSDEDALYPLQSAYLIEEVIPSGSIMNEGACRLVLRKILRTQYTLGALVPGVDTGTNHVFCAKAGVNACGLHWMQVGGVFTQPPYRSRGIASYLVKTIAEYAGSHSCQTALFVQDINSPAQQAYTNAGFSRAGKYRIVYYKAEVNKQAQGVFFSGAAKVRHV